MNKALSLSLVTLAALQEGCGFSGLSGSKTTHGSSLNGLSVSISSANRVTVSGDNFIIGSTGTVFTPRGANYDRFGMRTRADGQQEWWFNTFDVGIYDAASAENALNGLQASQYNLVRVMLAGPNLDNGFGLTSRGIGSAYLNNAADFLRRARNHGVRVSFEGAFESDQLLPKNYLGLAGGAVANVSGANRLLLNPGYVQAMAYFYQDFLNGLKAYPDDLLSVLFSIQLFNEVAVNKHDTPFSQASGSFSFGGQNYDLSNAISRQALINNSTVNWMNTIVSAVHGVDPQLMVSASLFTLGATGNMGGFDGASLYDGDDGTGRVALNPRAIASSNASFVDIHVYPYGANYNFSADMANEQMWAGQSIGKPLLMGEVGAFKGANPTRQSVVATLGPAIASSCQYGFKGWSFWTWDNAGDKPTDTWSLAEQDGAINAFFAPSANPNLCVAPALPTFQPNGFFSNSGTIYYSNGVDAFCGIKDWDDFINMTVNFGYSNVTAVASLPTGQRNDGICRSPATVPGFFKRPDNPGGIYYSNGVDAYCVYPTWDQYLAAGGKADQSNVHQLGSPPADWMRNDGSCH